MTVSEKMARIATAIYELDVAERQMLSQPVRTFKEWMDSEHKGADDGVQGFPDYAMDRIHESLQNDLKEMRSFSEEVFGRNGNPAFREFLRREIGGEDKHAPKIERPGFEFRENHGGCKRCSCFGPGKLRKEKGPEPEKADRLSLGDFAGAIAIMLEQTLGLPSNSVNVSFVGVDRAKD